MADIQKPDMSKQWASSGDKTAPADSLIASGWNSGDIPTNTDFNFIDARQDQGLAYVLQKGIPEWDASTEYQVNKSFVQYNGKLYKSLQTATNKQPDVQTTFWADILATSTSITSILRRNVAYTITSTDFGQAVALYGTTARTFTFPSAADNYGANGVVIANFSTQTLTLASASTFSLNGSDVSSVSVAADTAYYVVSVGTKWLVKQIVGSVRIGSTTYKVTFSTSNSTPKAETYPATFLAKAEYVIGATDNDTYPFAVTTFNLTGYSWGARNTGGSYVAGAKSVAISVGN